MKIYQGEFHSSTELTGARQKPQTIDIAFFILFIPCDVTHHDYTKQQTIYTCITTPTYNTIAYAYVAPNIGSISYLYGLWIYFGTADVCLS